MSTNPLVLLAALLIAGSTISGQQALRTHRLQGTVTDPEGHPLAGVVVELSLPAATNSLRTLTTAADGRYDFERIVPGLYVLTMQLPGFSPAIRDVEVGDGDEAFQFDVQLKPRRPDGPVDQATTLPERRVVCGLTLITPRNADPGIFGPRRQPQPTAPLQDRMPGAPQPQTVPGPTLRGTIRTIQPTVCREADANPK